LTINQVSVSSPLRLLQPSSTAARHAEKIDLNQTPITRRTGALSFVAIPLGHAASANQQVGAGFRVRAGPARPETAPLRTVAGGDNQRHVFSITSSTRPQIGYSYRVALLDSH
jgi:hypothetical protein